MNSSISPTRARRELTIRAIVTGIILGALLTPSNIYTGLKIGWSFNMSIISALLSFAFWKSLSAVSSVRSWGLYESNINQTTASSAASIISGGLVAPIPALAIVSGIELPWFQLIIWVFAVSFLGVWVAYFLLNTLLVRTPLPFPAGVATAEVITNIYADGKEALRRVSVLVGAAVTAAMIKAADLFLISIPRITVPGTFTLPLAGEATGLSVSLKNLSILLDPSPLFFGFGAIIGIRIGLSLLIGSLVAWGVVAPLALYMHWAVPGPLSPESSWFGTIVEWLLWPGVALMVSSVLTDVLRRLFVRSRKPEPTDQSNALSAYRISPYIAGLFAGASLLVIFTQIWLFGTSWWLAVITIPFALLFGIVAGRVVGETGIPPIGAIGQVTQLNMGIIAPGQLTPNLTSANVAGGTAGQCADLLNDFKTGQIIGANPTRQVIAQCFGVLTGAIVGSLTYITLIPEPTTMLITDEWPAPAVLTWKVVAEALQVGLNAVPAHAQWAMLVGAVIGSALAILEWLLPKPFNRLTPSATAIGLAFVIPASISISMAFGAIIAFCLQRYLKSWSSRFLIVTASGLVAGESMTGVVSSVVSVLL